LLGVKEENNENITSIRIVEVPAEIRTENLTSKSLERYHCSNPMDPYEIFKEYIV
jgi:hypothetical protein